jgi:hypothetical protein
MNLIVKNDHDYPILKYNRKMIRKTMKSVRFGMQKLNGIRFFIFCQLTFVGFWMNFCETTMEIDNISLKCWLKASQKEKSPLTKKKWKIFLAIIWSELIGHNLINRFSLNFQKFSSLFYASIGINGPLISSTSVFLQKLDFFCKFCWATIGIKVYFIVSIEIPSILFF